MHQRIPLNISSLIYISKTEINKNYKATLHSHPNLEILYIIDGDGFIETTVGRGSFVSAQNKDFFQEEQQRRAEEHLQEAADIAHSGGIPLSKLVEILTMFYQEEG